MATAITVQELPANAVAIDDLTFTAGDDTGMTFINDGNTILIIKNTDAAATPAVSADGVAAADSGRDGTSVATLAAGIGNIAILGPFKTRNWNTSTGVVDLSMSVADAPNLELAAVRYQLG